MACGQPLMQCVTSYPEVAVIGAAVGFIIAKAMNMNNRNRGGMGMM